MAPLAPREWSSSSGAAAASFYAGPATAGLSPSSPRWKLLSGAPRLPLGCLVAPPLPDGGLQDVCLLRAQVVNLMLSEHHKPGGALVRRSPTPLPARVALLASACADARESGGVGFRARRIAQR